MSPVIECQNLASSVRVQCCTNKSTVSSCRKTHCTIHAHCDTCHWLTDLYVAVFVICWPVFLGMWGIRTRASFPSMGFLSVMYYAKCELPSYELCRSCIPFGASGWVGEQMGTMDRHIDWQAGWQMDGQSSMKSSDCEISNNKKCLQKEDWSKINEWWGLLQRKRNDLFYWMTKIGYW